MSEAPATLPAFCTATPQDAATRLNVWDVAPPCPGSEQDFTPHSRQGSTVAAAAAMQYRQMKQRQEQKQHLLASTCGTVSPQIPLMGVNHATTLFNAVPSGLALTAVDSCSSTGNGSGSTGSSVSSLYGRLRTGAAMPQASVSCKTTAAAVRGAGSCAERMCSSQLLNATSASTAPTFIAANRSPSNVDQASNTDMLSLLLAATHMSSTDSPASTHAINSAGYMTAAPGSFPANHVDASILRSSTAAMPPGLLSMGTTDIWPNNSIACCSSDADAQQAGLMPQDRLQLLQQLQQLQANQALSTTAAVSGGAQAMQAAAGMHATAATVPAAMLLVGHSDSLTPGNQVAYLQQQQQHQVQVVPMAGLNTAPNNINISSNTGPPTAMFHYTSATAPQAGSQAAAGQVYQLTATNTATITMQGMADASFILQPQDQQLLQMRPALTHIHATGPQSVSSMGATCGNVTRLQPLPGFSMPAGDAAPLGSSSATGDSSWQGRADRHATAAAPHNPLYKTELCRSWLDTGSCRYGARCQFAHGQIELRPVLRPPKYKTQPCRTFSSTGKCPYGARCNFIHDEALALSGYSSAILGGVSSANTVSSATERDVQASDAATGASILLSRALSNFSSTGTGDGASSSAAASSSQWQLGTGSPHISHTSNCTGHSRTSSSTGLQGLGLAMQMAGGAVSAAGMASGDAKNEQLRELMMQLPKQ